MTEERNHAGFRVAGNAAAAALLIGAGNDSWTDRDPRGLKSTGVGGKRGEPIGDSLGELMKGLALAAGMAADLAVVEDQGQSVGQKTDHR